MLDCGALLRRTVPVQSTSTVLVGLLVVLSFRIQEGRGRLGPRPQHPFSERGTLCCSFGPSKRIGNPGFDFSAAEGDTTLTEYWLISRYSYPKDHHRHAGPLQLARQGRPIRLDPTPLAGLELPRARTAAAPERRRSHRPPAATPVPPLPPVSDCPGPSTAPRPDVARSRARSPRRGEAATDVAIVACSVPASPASPSPRRPSTGGECLGC